MTFQTYVDTERGLEPSSLSRFTFPAGEQAVRSYIEADRSGNHVAFVRGTDANDYVALGIWARTVRLGGGSPRAIVPYLPGARDDRHGGAGARAYAALINAAETDQVICLDPHSHYMPDLIRNVTVVDPGPLLVTILERTLKKFDGVIIPDEGAKERSMAVAELLNVPTYQATKKRNPDTGQLFNFTCERLPDHANYIVVDDICDGGGTFMGLADVLDAATNRPATRNYALWVTHGVFSGVAKKLREKYRWIYTTDSIKPQDDSVADYTAPVLPYLTQHLK
jgi:ribose-phosphate pyrophosphokinase